MLALLRNAGLPITTAWLLVDTACHWMIITVPRHWRDVLPETSTTEFVHRIGELMSTSPVDHEIFDAINRARSSSAIVATPLVRGKVTLVHRRLWPPLVRLADRFDVGALDVLHEEHSASGAHRVTRTAFPGWVPSDVMVSAQELSEEEALTQLPEWLRDVVVGISRPK